MTMDKKILLVDDEADLLEVLSTFFTDDGWVVETAADGEEAFSKIAAFKPTVIVSDINMPKLDGLDLLEKLFNADSMIPVILTTGYRDLEKMQRAWAACAFDFLDKPGKKEDMLTLANNAHNYGSEYLTSARKRYLKRKKTA
jgi:two-component system, NtrC family, nitrogen regulation response regulator NtrX